jgi:methionine synthase II (cobalamin-independent)
VSGPRRKSRGTSDGRRREDIDYRRPGGERDSRERSGSFEPLRFVPEDQTVVLGLVTTKTPELESKDDLKRRVDEAAKYVDLERLCLSGQCGFASTVEGNSLTIDEERAKLELIATVAEEIWGR